MGRKLGIITFLITATLAAAAEHRGIVRSAGLPIPGASITARQGDVLKVTSTDESGSYVFEDLAPGRWTLDVEMAGFEKANREIVVTANSKTEWELTLAAPATAVKQGQSRNGFERVRLNRTARQDVLQQAEAAAQSTPVQITLNQSQNATESFLVSGSLSHGLQLEPPMGGPEEFGGPGMGGPGMGGPGMGPPPGGMTGGGRRAAMAMGGGPGRGGPGGPGGGPGGPGGPPPDLGGPGGMGRPGWIRQRNVTAFGNRRLGTQEGIRGALNFSLGNSAFDARSYSLTGKETEKSPYAKVRFGIAAGGQLRIPKIVTSENTFFFVNYSGTRSRNASNHTATLPTSLERAGDFSASTAAEGVNIYDPLGGSLFPNNVIPVSRLSSAATGLFSYIPLPNVSNAVQNYQYTTSVPSDSNSFGVRLNHTLSQKDSLSGNFQIQNQHSESSQSFGYRDTTDGRNWSADLGWTRTIRTTLINTVRWRFSHSRSESLPYFAYGTDVASELGILGTSRDPVNYGPPNLDFTNYGGLTDGNFSLMRNQSSSVGDDIMWIKGNHNFKFGAEFRRNQINKRSDANGRGAYTFSGNATAAYDADGNVISKTGFDLADFLLGYPESGTIQYGNSSQYFRASTIAGFAMDDWRVNSKLTVNLGVRYEFTQPFREKYDHMANFDVAPGFTAVSVVTPGKTGPYSGTFPRGLIDSDWNNFAPRIAIAWRPWAKRSLRVRSGYGIYFNGSVYNQAANQLGQQPPFATTATLTTGSSNVLTIKDGFTAASTSTTDGITNTYAVARDYGVGYAQTWNLNIQQNLTRTWVLDLGYLGTKGTRLDVQRVPNQMTSAGVRKIANASAFTFDSSDGQSIYHAGQVRLMRRFRRGLSTNLLYTWAKSIDNVSSFGGGQGVVAQDYQNLAAERGLSSFDKRHNLTAMFMISSPVGDGPSSIQLDGWARRLLEEWTFNGNITLGSSTPFTAKVAGTSSDAGRSGVVGSARADATGESVTAGSGFFNTAAFSVPAPGTFGNAARNTIPGPRQFSVNMSLGRSFSLPGERRNVEFRAEAQNVFNNVNYTGLSTTVNSSEYGRATSAGSMRSVSLSMRLRF